jgi:hypothetical protein
MFGTRGIKFPLSFDTCNIHRLLGRGGRKRERKYKLWLLNIRKKEGGRVVNKKKLVSLGLVY